MVVSIDVLVISQVMTPDHVVRAIVDILVGFEENQLFSDSDILSEHQSYTESRVLQTQHSWIDIIVEFNSLPAMAVLW